MIDDGQPALSAAKGWTTGDRPKGGGASALSRLSGLLLPVTLALMTAAWVGAVLAVFSARTPAGVLASPPVIVLALWWLGGWFVTRWSLGQPWGERRGGQVVAISGVVAVLVGLWWLYMRLSYNLWDVRWLGALWQISLAQVGSGLTVPLLSALAGLLLWWRGIVAGREPVIGYDAVYRGFNTGVVAWMGTLIVAEADGEWTGLMGQMLLFFLAGLGGLALASLASVQRQNQGQAGLGVSRFWLVAVASVILTILALGVLMSQLLAPELFAQLLALFRPIVSLLAQGLYVLLTAIVALVFLVLGPIIEFLRPRSSSTPLPTLQPDPFESFRREMEQAAQGSQAAPGWMVALVQALLVLALLVAVLFFLSRAFRRLRLLDSEGVEEMREPIGSWALLWAQLGALLRRLRRRRVPLVADSPFLPLEAVPGEAGRLSVREVYRQLLVLARERGVPHARSQTPYEYQGALSRAFPNHQEEVGAITEAYVAARYGPIPPPETVVSWVNRAWQAVLRGRRTIDDRRR